MTLDTKQADSKDRPMNRSQYVEKAKALRHTPMIEAWIKRYWPDEQPANCNHCSFPHPPQFLCPATFGTVVFGDSQYSVNLNNVVFWYEFMQEFAPKGAFHWRHERFFKRVPEGVEVTFFTRFNSTPQRNTWLIPALEWDSIVSQMSADNAKRTAP